MNLIAGGLGLLVLASLWRTWTASGITLTSESDERDGVSAAKHSVSIVIPSWNDASVLERTVSALKWAAESYEGYVEFWVVSGGNNWSRSATEGMVAGYLASFPWSVIEQGPQGKNAALNLGLKSAQGEFVVFVDADTEVDRGWLERIIEPLNDPNVGASTGNFSAFASSPVSRLYECAQIYNQDLRGRASLFGGGTIAIKRSVLVQLGGTLDESVRVGVDYHLSEQVKALGYQVAFAREARVRTEISATWQEHWRNERRWRRAYWWNQARLLVTDRSPSRLIALVYTPLVGIFTILGSSAILVSIVGVLPWGWGDWLWLVVWVWLLGRYLTQPVWVYRSTHQSQWLQLIPAFVLDFYLGLTATWIGICTPRRLNPHFKGRRVTAGMKEHG